MKFEIKDRDAAGRICKFSTKHGTVITPNLMPVINPNKIQISPKDMKKLFGTEIVITNSYIINKYDEFKEKALKKGVHKLIDFEGPIMTDSGAFQSYVYGDIDIDPIDIVRFQREIGSDVGTILDIFGTPDQTKKEASQGVKETIERTKKSIPEKKDMLLACTIQGSIYPDLRTKCAEEISKTDADFYPIGGIVPLMENQRYLDVIRCIISSKKGLNPSKPVHLFGAGHPLIFPIAVALGCDFFDSSAYAKYANDGRMIFPWGTEKIDDISETPCCCPVCTDYTATELKKLDKKDQILQLAKHNLYVSFSEIRRIRNAISMGNLWELVERRANSNPHLLDALKELKKTDNKIWLEKYEPISKKKALFYTGEHTIHRPIIYRNHRRLLNRYKQVFNTTIVFKEGIKPYSVHYFKEIKDIINKKNVNIIVNSNLGPVPIELDEIYPYSQSIFPDIVDDRTKEESSKIFNDFLIGKKTILWEDFKSQIKSDKPLEKSINMDLRRISAVSDIQFGKDASKALFKGKIKFIKSKKTGKIRNIYRNEKHILSMRASDGMFTLKINGGYLLHRYFKYPKLRVVVKEDAVSFIKDGKSVFAKFVKYSDESLRPLDECLVVNEKDYLLAVGRCLLNHEEMRSFNFGMAVKTRETINELTT
jgi:7-cyano-7-deazaguanine tRNA-ribosyltransferase